MVKIIDIVRNNKAKFDCLNNNSLWYYIIVNGVKYMFEIPLNETNGGTFKYEDKAIFFMRWIRKAIENNEFYRVY